MYLETTLPVYLTQNLYIHAIPAWFWATLHTAVRYYGLLSEEPSLMFWATLLVCAVC
jgi:hypothetical protein